MLKDHATFHRVLGCSLELHQISRPVPIEFQGLVAGEMHRRAPQEIRYGVRPGFRRMPGQRHIELREPDAAPGVAMLISDDVGRVPPLSQFAAAQAAAGP